MMRGRKNRVAWPSACGSLAVALMLFAPVTARAQDLEQGKSAAQLFSSNCTACHKTPQGLGTGRNVGALTTFLRQHYTTGVATASALAAYVAGAGPAPASRSAARPQPPGAAERGERTPQRQATAPHNDQPGRPAEEAKKRNAAPPPRRPSSGIPSVESDPAPVEISHDPVALPPAPPPAPKSGRDSAAAGAQGRNGGAAAVSAAAAKPDQAGFSSPLP